MNFSDLTMKGILIENHIYLTDDKGELVDYFGRPIKDSDKAVFLKDHYIEPGVFIPERIPFIFRVTYEEEPEEGWHRRYGSNPIRMVTKRYIRPVLTFERIK